MSCAAALLEQSIGLALPSIGEEPLLQAVAARRALLRLDPEAYDRHLASSRAEQDALVEEIVVPETWFFRDGTPFSFLAAQATSLRASLGRPLRLLSAPCSTGEEPYSMAITLLEAGLTPEDFHVEAIDISQRAIDHARAAVYRASTFRSLPPGLDAHFLREDSRLLVRGAALRCVSFRRENLLSSAGPLGLLPHDIIFCRNLFIYLTPAAKKQLLARLLRALAPHGALFLGHADASQETSAALKLLSAPAFAYERRAPAPAPSPRAAARVEAEAPPSVVGRGLPDRPTASTSAATSRSPAPPAASTAAGPAPAPGGSLTPARLRQIADQGRLEEARRGCEQSLQERGPDAELFALLGFLLAAEGKHTEAEEPLRKALYLDPTHEDALLLTAILRERSGDLRGAQRLRARLAEQATGKGPA